MSYSRAIHNGKVILFHNLWKMWKSVNKGLTKPFSDVDKVVTKKLFPVIFPSFASFPPCV